MHIGGWRWLRRGSPGSDADVLLDAQPIVPVRLSPITYEAHTSSRPLPLPLLLLQPLLLPLILLLLLLLSSLLPLLLPRNLIDVGGVPPHHVHAHALLQYVPPQRLPLRALWSVEHRWGLYGRIYGHEATLPSLHSLSGPQVDPAGVLGNVHLHYRYTQAQARILFTVARLCPLYPLSLCPLRALQLGRGVQHRRYKKHFPEHVLRDQLPAASVVRVVRSHVAYERPPPLGRLLHQR
mmetsp:Transcript_18298/g.40652  ORF Transcript_18298/g.40652 Transcript_18298/m.40652 type:complete len:237 (-) Transcript_18298:2313-3023(-)